MTREVIKSNTGAAGPLPGSGTINRDLPITSVTLETKDLKDADAYLSFTCNINLPPSTTASLIFIIKKYSDKGSSHEIGSSYVFSGESGEDFESKVFSFQFIDRDIHPGKFTYSIQLASNSISSSNSGTTITNATLNVIALGRDEKEKKGGNSGSSSSKNSNSSSNNSSDNNSNNNSSQNSENNASENSQNTASQSNEAKESQSSDKSDKKDKENKQKENKDSKEKDCKNKNKKDK